ncbi:hypothetical protein SPFL3102_03211 [Sporomusaceae bacterium FL31]|nr:hypothetical protein SPFL3102_03211 [Sporomusaceae bacterium]
MPVKKTHHMMSLFYFLETGFHLLNTVVLTRRKYLAATAPDGPSTERAMDGIAHGGNGLGG